MDYIKGINTYINDTSNKIQVTIPEIVRINNIKHLSKI